MEKYMTGQLRNETTGINVEAGCNHMPTEKVIAPKSKPTIEPTASEFLLVIYFLLFCCC
jgi:hypothetical protein